MDVAQKRAVGLSLSEALGVFSTEWYIAWVGGLLLHPFGITINNSPLGAIPQTQYYSQWIDILQFALTYKKVQTMPNHWDHAWRIAEILRLLGEGPASLCELDRIFQPMDWGLGGCDECKVQTWREDIEGRILDVRSFSTFV